MLAKVHRLNFVMIGEGVLPIEKTRPYIPTVTNVR